MPDPTSLNNLHDIIAPGPVPAWPPAPGWYILAALSLFLAIATIACLFHKHRKNLYRRQALAELTTTKHLLTHPETCAQAITLIAALLKRTAITAFGRDHITPLSSSQWINLLTQTCPQINLTDKTKNLLLQGPYDPNTISQASTTDLQNLYAAAHTWITRHVAAHHQEGSKC